MFDYFDKFLLAFIPLFVAMGPIGLIPIFIGLTEGMPEEDVHKVAHQGTYTAALVAVGFMFLGKFVFQALGITVSDFQVAGGLILLAIAARDIIVDEPDAKLKSHEFGVVPLGMPLITGPATITTLLILVDSVGILFTFIGLFCNLALIHLAFKYSQAIRRRIGLAGLRACSKIMSLLLAAIAIHLIRLGWQVK